MSARIRASTRRGLVADIKEQINNLFSDTSVGPEVTREHLESIREEIDSLLDTLPPRKRD